MSLGQAVQAHNQAFVSGFGREIGHFERDTVDKYLAIGLPESVFVVGEAVLLVDIEDDLGVYLVGKNRLRRFFRQDVGRTAEDCRVLYGASLIIFFRDLVKERVAHLVFQIAANGFLNA